MDCRLRSAARAAGMLAALTAAVLPAWGRPLIVATRKDAAGAALAAVYADPFATATGIGTQTQDWPGGLDVLRAKLSVPPAKPTAPAAPPPASAPPASPAAQPIAAPATDPDKTRQTDPQATPAAPRDPPPATPPSAAAAKPGLPVPPLPPNPVPSPPTETAQAKAPAADPVSARQADAAGPPVPASAAPGPEVPAWDVVLVSAGELQAGCDAGLFDKLDWAAIGGKAHYRPEAISDCGVGGVVSALVLSWDRDKFPGTPTWADFFDVAKYPGKRGLRRDVRSSLEFALMADGVAPGDVYKTLRGSDGVDRAFHKLDQLKPYIVWWSTAAEAARLLGSGEVLMTAAPNGVVSVADRDEHRNFGLQWAGSLISIQSWAVARHSPSQAQAIQFLYFAGMPAAQVRMLERLPYPGLAHGTNALASPTLRATSPTLPANASQGLLADEGFWRDNRDKLAQRFADWLAH